MATWIAVPIDRRALLQELLQTWAFCLAIAGLQVGFEPERPFLAMAVFSLCIGTTSWLVIDVGRHFFPSAATTGWPPGWRGPVLVAAGIAAGFVLGTRAADGICKALGWYGDWQPAAPSVEWRRALMITAAAGVAGSAYFYLRSASQHHERQAEDARQRASESRLKLLETQLEPHMLFNTLANLRVLIGIDPARAQAMLDHLHDYLRATLQASRATRHDLGTEFARLADYLALMQIRMGPRLHTALDLPDALRTQLVPTLLLQPLVENAIKHGLEPHPEGGRIRVQARIEEAHLVLEVSNTGATLGPAVRATDGTRFGLQQVRERLATIYGSAASLSLIAGAVEAVEAVEAARQLNPQDTALDPSSTCARIRLPLRATTPAGTELISSTP